MAANAANAVPITLMDIFNMETSLGDKILCDNKASITVCINNTCRMFNKKTKEDLAKYREEYNRVLLSKNIQDTIENKALSILKKMDNTITTTVNFYITPEEYEKDLEAFASQINESNYDIILAKMMYEFKDYVREYYLYDNNRRGRHYMFGALMDEHYKFIKYHMKHEFKKEDFNEEEDYDIYDIVMSYDYENE